jgi:hypothetical protein
MFDIHFNKFLALRIITIIWVLVLSVAILAGVSTWADGLMGIREVLKEAGAGPGGADHWDAVGAIVKGKLFQTIFLVAGVLVSRVLLEMYVLHRREQEL